nr:MAG TPA: hypothetical protein [Caudoviricetes sp.]
MLHPLLQRCNSLQGSCYKVLLHPKTLKFCGKPQKSCNKISINKLLYKEEFSSTAHQGEFFYKVGI